MKDQENVLIVSLVQAMLGAISPNFRAVSLEVTEDSVVLYFLLEKDDPEDRDEIEDIVFRFEALQSQRINLHVVTELSRKAFVDLQLIGRIVYMRKE